MSVSTWQGVFLLAVSKQEGCWPPPTCILSEEGGGEVVEDKRQTPWTRISSEGVLRLQNKTTPSGSCFEQVVMTRGFSQGYEG